MTTRPETIDTLAAIVPTRPRWRVRGGGTKPALSSPDNDTAVLDLSSLSGIVEYSPEECTFTARAGTRLGDIALALAGHGQYLPFDPPLVDAGATIGGTVAAGLSGSGRYRFGGVRDFLIGACIVDGEGRVLRSGGKVVKNAAGFLLHQAMCGSAGTLGVLAEVTFKVFPSPGAHVTVRVPTVSIEDALACAAGVQQARIDLAAIDVTSSGALWLRLAGHEGAIPERTAALVQLAGPEAEVVTGDDDERVWREAREFGWADRAGLLVRVPTTPAQARALHGVLGETTATWRVALAGHLVWIAWPASPPQLDAMLVDMDLTGQVLVGPPGRPWIGAVPPNPFGQRLRDVMDPSGRFQFIEHAASAVVPAGV